VLPGPRLLLRHPHATDIIELPLRTARLLLALVTFGAGLQVPPREPRLLVRRSAALSAPRPGDGRMGPDQAPVRRVTGW
jgi:bile acid:Na+ symporter, BASS family